MNRSERPRRADPPYSGDERATLEGFLDYHRSTLAQKCHGLSEVELRQRALPPSSMSLLGLVRHLAEVERGWFHRVVAGGDLNDRWITDDDPDADFDRVDEADVGEAFAAWAEECDVSRAVVAETKSLDATFIHSRRGDVSMRWVLLHMIEEYARHNGHADLLRERVDGSTGE